MLGRDSQHGKDRPGVGGHRLCWLYCKNHCTPLPYIESKHQILGQTDPTFISLIITSEVSWLSGCFPERKQHFPVKETKGLKSSEAGREKEKLMTGENKFTESLMPVKHNPTACNECREVFLSPCFLPWWC